MQRQNPRNAGPYCIYIYIISCIFLVCLCRCIPAHNTCILDFPRVIKAFIDDLYSDFPVNGKSPKEICWNTLNDNKTCWCCTQHWRPFHPFTNINAAISMDQIDEKKEYVCMRPFHGPDRWKKNCISLFMLLPQYI